MLLFCCCFIVLFCFSNDWSPGPKKQLADLQEQNHYSVSRGRRCFSGGREEFLEFQGATCESFVALLYAPLRQKHFLQLPASQASHANG